MLSRVVVWEREAGLWAPGVGHEEWGERLREREPTEEEEHNIGCCDLPLQFSWGW
jgi:hypothetical protein